jgi:hypothetical protein
MIKSTKNNDPFKYGRAFDKYTKPFIPSDLTEDEKVKVTERLHKVLDSLGGKRIR